MSIGVPFDLACVSDYIISHKVVLIYAHSYDTIQFIRHVGKLVLESATAPLNSQIPLLHETNLHANNK